MLKNLIRRVGKKCKNNQTEHLVPACCMCCLQAAVLHCSGYLASAEHRMQNFPRIRDERRNQDWIHRSSELNTESRSSHQLAGKLPILTVSILTRSKALYQLPSHPQMRFSVIIFLSLVAGSGPQPWVLSRKVWPRHELTAPVQGDIGVSGVM